MTKFNPFADARWRTFMVAIMVTATPVTTVSGFPALKVSTVSFFHSTPTCFLISSTNSRAVTLPCCATATELSENTMAITPHSRSSLSTLSPLDIPRLLPSPSRVLVPLRTLGHPNAMPVATAASASAPRLRRLGRLAEAIVPHPCSANQIGVVAQRSKRQFCFLRRNETTSAANHFPNAIEKERRALHDAATQHDSVGRKKIDQIGDSQA